MTLKTRNRALLLFICFSILCAIAFATVFILKVFSPSFENIFGYKFFSLNGFSFFQPADKTVLFSLIFLQFFVCLTSILLFVNFEKTQSTLIILFALFLLGCQLQVSRIYIMLFNLVNSFSLDYLVFGKLSIMGKLLAISSFFLIAAESRNSRKLNIEMDIFVTTIFCFIITISVPLRTAIPSKNFGITPGYLPVLTCLCLVTGILTVISFFVSYKETEEKNILRLLMCYAIIMLGFFIMINSNIFWIALIGSAGLSYGTHLFMHTLHKMYLWS